MNELVKQRISEWMKSWLNELVTERIHDHEFYDKMI